jgi:hypothetical protein
MRSNLSRGELKNFWTSDRSLKELIAHSASKACLDWSIAAWMKFSNNFFDKQTQSTRRWLTL